jgi:hypothetical protein
MPRYGDGERRRGAPVIAGLLYKPSRASARNNTPGVRDGRLENRRLPGTEDISSYRSVRRLRSEGADRVGLHVHEAITASDADDQVIDHTGRLLRVMASADGMGMTWKGHPPIQPVLDAHVGHLARQAPTMARYIDAALIVDHLAQTSPGAAVLAPQHKDHLLNRYLAVLRSSEWSETARTGYDPASKFHAWFAEKIAVRLQLPAFTESGTVQ